MTGLPVIAADLALGKLVYEMMLHRCAHHFSVSARYLVERPTAFHFYETDFAVRRRITSMIAAATMAAAGYRHCVYGLQAQSRIAKPNPARLRRQDRAARKTPTMKPPCKGF
jgi:hypothetical protein